MTKIVTILITPMLPRTSQIPAMVWWRSKMSTEHLHACNGVASNPCCL